MSTVHESKCFLDLFVMMLYRTGLGAEVAKNLVLAGVSKVDVHDPSPAAFTDLSSNFLLQEDDVGHPLDRHAAERLAPMNPYVRVQAIPGPFWQAADLRGYTAIVAIDRPLKEQIQLCRAAREAGCQLICADSRGVFGRVFCDFGDDFEVRDNNGEEPKQVSALTNGPLLCSCLAPTDPFCAGVRVVGSPGARKHCHGCRRRVHT